MAKVLLSCGVLLLFGISLLNLSEGFNDIAVGYAIAGAVLLFLVVFYLYALKPLNLKLSRDKLLIWLIENEEMVLTYGDKYNNENVNSETLIVRYCIIYSFISICRRTYSNYSIAGSNRASQVKFVSTVFNFVFGWWSLPWGFIYTPIALSINLQNKEAITVEEFLANKEQYMDKEIAFSSWFQKSYS